MPSKAPRRHPRARFETNVPPFALAEKTLDKTESEETSASPRALSEEFVCRFIERAAFVHSAYPRPLFRLVRSLVRPGPLGPVSRETVGGRPP